jgi:hypothetical protein
MIGFSKCIPPLSRFFPSIKTGLNHCCHALPISTICSMIFPIIIRRTTVPTESDDSIIARIDPPKIDGKMIRRVAA